MIYKFLILAWVQIITFQAFPQSLNSKNWTEDLEQYQIMLEKNHIDLYHNISQSDFDKELQNIRSNLIHKSDLEVIIDLMRLTRKIGDGHTAVSLRNLDVHLFPIEIKNFKGDCRVVKVRKEYKNLLGKKLLEIDGKPLESFIEEVKEIAQFVENPQSEIIRTADYLMISEILFGLNITQNKLRAAFTFSDDSNEVTRVNLNALSSEDFDAGRYFISMNFSIPEIQKPIESPEDFLWFSPIKNTNGVYIKFENYPSFEEMEIFGERVLSFINEHQIKQLVIDLRNNGGGDFFVGSRLAYHLNLANSIDWKSGIYVLTDKVTFSAATTNATQFRQILNAKVVGEPTGSNPTGYQDMGAFELPNFGLVICYSKRKFRFQEHANQGLQPDVLMEYEWESFSKGMDNMMEWVIRDMRN